MSLNRIMSFINIWKLVLGIFLFFLVISLSKNSSIDKNDVNDQIASLLKVSIYIINYYQ